MRILAGVLACSIGWESLAQTGANYSNPFPGVFTTINDNGLSASLPVYTDGSKNLTSTAPTGYSAVLSGTSGSLGGSALTAGQCSSITVSVASLTTAMDVHATPVTYPGDGYWWEAYASSAGTATVKVCASVAGTPTASTYNVRVVQ